jgi:hypothetical protein
MMALVDALVAILAREGLPPGDRTALGLTHLVRAFPGFGEGVTKTAINAALYKTPDRFQSSVEPGGMAPIWSLTGAAAATGPPVHNLSTLPYQLQSTFVEEQNGNPDSSACIMAHRHVPYPTDWCEENLLTPIGEHLQEGVVSVSRLYVLVQTPAEVETADLTAALAVAWAKEKGIPAQVIWLGR